MLGEVARLAGLIEPTHITRFNVSTDMTTPYNVNPRPRPLLTLEPLAIRSLC